MNTDDLIRSLSERPAPVKRLLPPVVRALQWAVLALAAVAAVVLKMGLRPDLAARLDEPAFLVQLAACAVTAFTAALAGLMLGIPGRPRAWALLPLPSFAVWLASFGRQCLLEWRGETEGELLIGPHFHCLPDIAVMMALPTLVIMAMVRRGAGFERRLETLLGGLAAAALANAALGLAHPRDAGLLVLLVQMMVVAALSWWMGRKRRSLP